jgi:acetyltransferase-like isoleucine patch superfamily enzyme
MSVGPSSPPPPPGSPASLLKRALDLVALVAVAPLALAYGIVARLARDRRDAAFQGCSQFLSLWPGPPGDLLRRAFYGLTLASAARDCSIQFGTTFATPNVRIGHGVYIGAHCNIGSCHIGDDTLLGSHVMVLSGKSQHHFDRLDIPIRHQGGSRRTLSIGRDVWIGNGAILLDDVGDQAIVAAGAVVTRAVEGRAIVGGNPARVIGQRGTAAPEPAAAQGPEC